MEDATVEPADAGKRIDQWLAARMPEGISRGNVQSMIAQGLVLIGGSTETSAKKKLKDGDVVAWQMPQPAPAEPIAQNIALDVIFEDADVIVINKPAGLVVHPGAGNEDGTLVNALLHHCAESLSGIGGVKRPGIVHRLDKDTSGIMVVAKNDQAHQHLSAQFADHGRTNDMRRIYSAIVWGVPPRAKSRIETLLGRSSSDRKKQAVVTQSQPDARHAVTRYEYVEMLHAGLERDEPVASLIDCELETGRTHQIRVHMAHIGHPLIGDAVYGAAYKTKANVLSENAQKRIAALHRQALHARLLAFEHPKTGTLLTFEAPIPDDLEDVLAALR